NYFYIIKEVKLENPEKVMSEYKSTGSLELRNKLVMHYLNLVNLAIYSMRSVLLSNVPFEDFFNQGVIALIDCLERYDPDRGASFDTYSYLAIRGSILKYMRKQNWLTNRAWDAQNKISQGRKFLEQKLMREPTDSELAEYLGITEQQLNQRIVEIASIDTISFEEMIEQAWEGVIEKSMDNSGSQVDSNLLENELRGELAKAIDCLDPKEKQIISLYYYENLNLREIGEVLDISQQRVSQIRKKALDKLYEKMKEYRCD
ncbi:MAG: FliA/WhiG family RNA polymerase sigma factor, partial [Clostridia bacterium]|nr:FliA/WhiG family RNA polymerase sigma factor [Clostridia bacterium]